MAPTLRSFRHYALSGLGIVSLLLSAIIAIISSIFGGGSEPIDPNANIVFTVVDQYGHGRRCLYQEKDAIQTDVARYTSPKGVIAFTMPPGYPLTIVFMCGGDSEDQDVEATLVAPETGRAETTVVIPDPDASPLQRISNTLRWRSGSGQAAKAAASACWVETPGRR
ncbi:MAG: hypothetical protein ACFNPU_07980 [Corynebacterium matruchotii]|uniref:hypothetical protein n=1 Tax=Corynebacterium matruchotii TaxID=43768 RepID=UPI003605E0DB